MSIDRQRYAGVREFGLQILWGPVLGAVLLTALPEMLRFSSQYRLILYGAIIVLVVLLRPDGLLKRRPRGLGLRLFGWQVVGTSGDSNNGHARSTTAMGVQRDPGKICAIVVQLGCRPPSATRR